MLYLPNFALCLDTLQYDITKLCSGTSRNNFLLQCGIVQYTAFDQFKQRMLKGKMKGNREVESSPESLSVFSAFVLGAVSKCFATCITYPLIRYIQLSISYSSVSLCQLCQTCKMVLEHLLLFYCYILGQTLFAQTLENTSARITKI